MTSINGYRRRLATSGLCGPIAILLFAVALLYNLAVTTTMGVAEGAYGPLSWPLFVLLILTGGLALLCALRLRRFLTCARAPAVQQSEPPAEPANGRAVIATGLIALYGLGFASVGFLLSTIVFLAAWLAYTRLRSPLCVGLISVLGTILPMYLLLKVAYMPLPRGTGVFERVTVQLYRWLGFF